MLIIRRKTLLKNTDTFSSSTNDISVIVRPEYLTEYSSPDTHQFTWAYHVEIKNLGRENVQILSRHWKIVDSNGKGQEIVGDGLVGEKPTLKPGESFEYTSGTPLNSPSGFMSGLFHAISKSHGRFNIEVPTFALDGPTRPKKYH